jgi:parvulin-like peptidyl-prolyl isomerase
MLKYLNDMKTPLQIIAIIICLIPICSSLLQAADAVESTDRHIQEGDRYFLNNQYFSAVNEYEQAVKNRTNNPELFRRLSFLYYHLGFLDKAVEAGEKAVSLSPDSELFRMELGVAYFAKNALDNAKEQFMAIIEKNPGLANPYYYLGEIFYQNKDYGMAWMFAKRSRCLGHRGTELFMKLSAVSTDPEKDPCIAAGDDLHIRQIFVASQSKAEEDLKRIAAGELFENIAMEEDTNKKYNVGGYMGKFAPSELHPDIVKALTANKAFSAPFIYKTESGFHIMQRIAPFDISYWASLLAGNVGQNIKQPQATEYTPPQAPVSPSISKEVEHDLASPPAGEVKKEGGFAGVLKVGGNSSTLNKKETYILYAGAYRERASAIDDVNKLHDLGYASFRYEEVTKEKGIYHVVVAGKYESYEKAKAAGEDIAKYGFTYFIRKKN